MNIQRINFTTNFTNSIILTKSLRSSLMHLNNFSNTRSPISKYQPKYHYQLENQEPDFSYPSKIDYARDRSNYSSKSNSHQITHYGIETTSFNNKNQQERQRHERIASLETRKSYLNKKYIKPEYRYLRHHRMSTQPDQVYSAYKNEQKYQRNQNEENHEDSQDDIRRRNEQKINNIERINDKIKRILETLNEEEKKMSNSQQYKIKKKSYMGRIKTEGDNEYFHPTKSVDNFQPRQHLQPKYRNYNYEEYESHLQRRSRYVQDENSVYHKLKDIKHKYQYSGHNRLNENRSTLGEITHSELNKRDEIIDGRKISFDSLVNCSSVIENSQIHNEDRNKSQLYEERTPIREQARNEQKEFQIKERNEDFESAKFGRKDNTNQTLHLFTPNKHKFYREGTSIESKEKAEQKQKNYDDEIEKIQDKIQELECIKRSLGLEPSPHKKNIREMIKMSHSRSKSTRSKQFSISRIQGSQEQKQKYERGTEHSHEHLSKVTGRFQSQISSQSRHDSHCTTNEQKELSQISIPKPFKISKKSTKRQLGESLAAESDYFVEQKLHENFNGFQSKHLSKGNTVSEAQTVKNSFGSILNYRSETEGEAKKVQKELIKKLCEQIELDSKLRDLKKWFTKKNSAYKWLQLKKCLEAMGHDRSHYEMLKQIMNEHHLKQIFTLSEEQDNPFYTQREEEGASYENLVKAYFQAQIFWSSKISHKFCESGINEIPKEIDIDRKGFIVIEDLVRYINIESDLYYRNRDIYLIFRRLSFRHSSQNPSNLQISYKDILIQLCRNFQK